MWADLIGIVAGFLLMLPGAKDNFYRFREADNRRRATGARARALFAIAAESWKQQRDAYSAWDSLCLALGGLGLMLSFALKLLGF